MTATRNSRGEAGEKLGLTLRQARKNKNLSLEEAASSLNIPLGQLRALEEGDFSVFSAEVYARGAYLKYAGWLGIASKDAQRSFLRALSAVRVVKPLNLHTPERWYERLINPRIIIIAAGVLLAGAVGAYIIWQIRSFWQLPDLSLASPVAGVIDQENIEVRGVSESQTKVRINGESTLLQPDGSFALTISLHPGINVIVVEAENAAGRIRTIERHILRPRAAVATGQTKP